jgi:hypothetical protein
MGARSLPESTRRGIDGRRWLLYKQTMRALLLLAAVLAVSASCKPDLIPGTHVENTSANRAVIEFLGKYHRAVVERSPDAVVSLTAADYFEDNGTIEQEDDYGREMLKEKLKADFDRTKEIQLEILVQQIERPEGERGPVKVAFRYSQRALVSFPAGEKWVSITDVNRLVLRPDVATGFLIAAGL